MASSRKSSSRKSSSRKSSNSNIDYNMLNDNDDNDNSVGIIIGIIINFFIVYYLINLEDKNCNCIRDWRHDYIKFFSIFNILTSIIALSNTVPKTGILVNTIGILAIINIYAFYTYIRDLNDTKCECAVVKQKNLNKFLNIYRYLIIIIPIFILIFALIFFSYLRLKLKN